MRVSAVVVNYNARELLLACLASVRAALESVDGATELIVVDNGSSDGSCEAVRDKFPDVRLRALSENRGFPTAASTGVHATTGDWILFVNNDATIEPDAITEMLAAVEGRDDVGSVAAQMLFAGTGLINSAGLVVDRLGIGFDRLIGTPAEASEPEPVEVFGACGGGALYRRAMLTDIGGIDESFFIFLEDADVAWRAQMRGWRSLYVPSAVVHHHHSATTGHGSSFKYFHVGLNRVRMLAKNAHSRQLRRYGLQMLVYDLGYVTYAAAFDRTLAPLRGRIQGLREWRAYRRGVTERTPIELAPVGGVRRALRRHRGWATSSVGAREGPVPSLRGRASG